MSSASSEEHVLSDLAVLLLLHSASSSSTHSANAKANANANAAPHDDDANCNSPSAAAAATAAAASRSRSTSFAASSCDSSFTCSLDGGGDGDDDQDHLHILKGTLQQLHTEGKIVVSRRADEMHQRNAKLPKLLPSVLTLLRLLDPPTERVERYGAEADAEADADADADADTAERVRGAACSTSGLAVSAREESKSAQAGDGAAPHLVHSARSLKEPPSASDAHLTALHPCPALYDQSLRVLKDLNSMACEIGMSSELERKSKMREIRSQTRGQSGKLRQLEESREKRWRMQRKERERYERKEREQKEGSKKRAMEDVNEMEVVSNIGKNDIVQGMESMDIDEDDDNGEDDDGTEPEPRTLSPTQRTVITLNSASIALPLLQSLTTHPRCRNASPVYPDLGPTDKKGRRKQRAYLFGDKVYGATTAKAFDGLCRQLKMTVEAFDGEGRSEDDGGHTSILDQLAASENTMGESTGGSFGTEYIIEKTLGSFLPTSTSDDDEKDAAATKRLDRARHLDSAIDHLSRTDPALERRHRSAIHRLQDKLSRTISYRMPDATLQIYGSCLSGLSLGHSSDVDMSLHLPDLLRLKQDFASGTLTATRYESEMKRIVFRVKGMLQHHRQQSFVDLVPVTRARIPVVKGRDRDAGCPYSEDGSLHFDICFLNDIAVANSTLIAEYSRIDPRVRGLMLAVKSFVKSRGVGSAADGTMSSYTWMVLVIFYLQCIDFVPNLQDVDVMRSCGIVPDPEGNPWHCVNGLNTAFASARDVLTSGDWLPDDRVRDMPVSALLHGFFRFYVNVFPRNIGAVSIRLGRCFLQKTSFSRSSRLWRMCIEDPFETYQSHFVHDLGIHCDERGHDLILRALRLGARTTEAVFALGGDHADPALAFHTFQDLVLLGVGKEDVPISNGNEGKEEYEEKSGEIVGIIDEDGNLVDGEGLLSDERDKMYQIFAVRGLFPSKNQINKHGGCKVTVAGADAQIPIGRVIGKCKYGKELLCIIWFEVGLCPDDAIGMTVILCARQQDDKMAFDSIHNQINKAKNEKMEATAQKGDSNKQSNENCPSEDEAIGKTVGEIEGIGGQDNEAEDCIATRSPSAAFSGKDNDLSNKGVSTTGEVDGVIGNDRDGKYHTAIVKRLFPPGFNMKDYLGCRVVISGDGDRGRISAPHGKQGHCKVWFERGLSAESVGKTVHLFKESQNAGIIESIGGQGQAKGKRLYDSYVVVGLFSKVTNVRDYVGCRVKTVQNDEPGPIGWIGASFGKKGKCIVFFEGGLSYDDAIGMMVVLCEREEGDEEEFERVRDVIYKAENESKKKPTNGANAANANSTGAARSAANGDDGGSAANGDNGGETKKKTRRRRKPRSQEAQKRRAERRAERKNAQALAETEG